MHRSAPGWLRASAALTLVAVVALQTAGNLSAQPAATEVINVVAVGASGEAVNGYQVVNRQASPNLSGCPGPSPAAVSSNIYACVPSEAAAEVCWPAPGSVLCLMDPWSKALRRFASPGALPAVESSAEAEALCVASRRRHPLHPAQRHRLGRQG